jgi:hypothetical protein
VIRQAISCDICGTEKKQTNHWFVAYDQGGELRVSGWNSRNRLRPGSKHLCGQTCLHKLVDDFMARALTARAPQAAQNDAANDAANENQVEFMEEAMGTDTSLTSDAAYKHKHKKEADPSVRLIAMPTPVAPALLMAAPAPVAPEEPIAAPTPVAPARPPLRMPMELVVVPARPRIEEAVASVDEPPRYASRNWRAAAWERERERELRAGERHPGMAHRRFSS